MQGVAVELLAGERKSDLSPIRPRPGPILRPLGGRVAHEVDPTGVKALNVIERSLNFLHRQQALDDGVTVLAIMIDVLVGDGHRSSSAPGARTLVPHRPYDPNVGRPGRAARRFRVHALGMSGREGSVIAGPRLLQPGGGAHFGQTRGGA